MIIETSSIYMSAEHQKSEFTEVTKKLDLDAFSNGFTSQLQSAKGRMGQANIGFINGLSADGRSESLQPASNFSSILVMTDEGLQFRTRERANSYSDEQQVTKAKLWQALLNAIQPDKKPVVTEDQIQLPEESTQITETGKGAAVQLSPLTMEMTFKMSESVEEYECSEFSSCGKVTTADGQTIEFDLDLKMERSYAASRSYEVTQEVVFTDPLIVNFDGHHADLSNEKFEFDLDADGNKELISYLQGNSAMLALDKNNDGTINNGSELFGALSGNGFADLSGYDDDGNNYIDEADAIFDQLKIWTKTADGESLESLQDRGIGAIYLGSTETPFDIKGEGNQENGRIRSSGVYLTEDGQVGTLQQVDMVV